MEIFMHNIAYAASDMDVRLALAEKLHSPPFPTDTPVNFGVLLFHKKKGCGTVTLPSKDLGNTFMRTYGSTGLYVKGRIIMFKPSSRALDDGRVKYLRSVQWKDPKVLQEEKQRRAQTSEPISLQDYSFGRFCRDGTFLTQANESLMTAKIACDLDRRQVRLTVTLQEHLGDIFEAILSPTVVASYTSPQIKRLITIHVMRQIPGVFLVSDTPPIFESYTTITLISDARPTRSQSLGTQSMLPMCHSLFVTFQPFKDRDTFLERCRLLRLPSPMVRDNVVCRPYVSSEEQRRRLDDLLGKLGFKLAFEIEKAFVDGALDPLEILSMEDDLMRLSSDQLVDAAAAFRYFLTTILGQHQVVTYRGRRRRRKGRQAAGFGGPEPTSVARMLQTALTAYAVDRGGRAVDSNPSFESYHLIVTPTSRILEGPLPDQSNSVLRRFENHECFLRVSIQEERKSKIRRDPNIDLGDILRTRFRPLLVNGLRLAGRHYAFLGYSMSGLKEHSVWFVTPFTESSGHEINAGTIREKLGDLAPLAHEPARLAARWAQAFSATDPSITLQESQIQRIPDRTSTQGSVFTDGCGTISADMSRTVWSRLCRQRARYSKSMTMPSCFQFRLGGAKGVVVQDPSLTGKVICIRPSQRKFEAPDVLTLDIQSTSSRPKSMFLNRPLIVLLEYLGVDSSSIIALQAAAIQNVQSLRTSLCRASDLFLQHGLGSSFHLPSLFNNIFKLLDLEISDQSSPRFFRHKLIEDALYCAATHALREIKYRAHILIPGSVTLLGVADEWDCLEEGEIYATVCDERTGKMEAIIGRVLVTRSPQVHPGDVQFVTAVRRPELSHLTNVVVFSCKGERDLPSCLGGGDLDGDDYNLILDINLHPPNVATPGAYIPLPRKRTEEACTIEDVADFVIDFIQTDLLGYISNLHLRIADLKDPGCSDCLKLAEAASHAVDFPKTGTPVEFNSLPRPPGKERPDFLAPESADTSDITLFYPSDKLLGVLYRSVPTEKPVPDLEPGASQTDGDTIASALGRMGLDGLGLPSLEEPSAVLMVEMEALFHDYYVEKLFSIAKTHAVTKHVEAVLSEAEIISGTIMAKWSDHRKRRDAAIAMNFQTHDLAKDIREDLYRVTVTDWDPDDIPSDDEDYDDEELEMGTAARVEVFKRAWAAWSVAEETLLDDRSSFGAQSFGLIALGVLLDIVKDARSAQ